MAENKSTKTVMEQQMTAPALKANKTVVKKSTVQSKKLKG